MLLECPQSALTEIASASERLTVLVMGTNDLAKAKSFYDPVMAALGAGQGNVLRLVVWEGLALTLAGVGIGLVLVFSPFAGIPRQTLGDDLGHAVRRSQ